MKICLVSTNYNRGDSPPLGLLYIATYLKENSDFNMDIHLVDANYDNIIEKILEVKPDVIGITSMTIDYSKVISFSKEIKNKLNIPIIIGGVHITTLPTSLNRCFDLGVSGEGEETFLELMNVFNERGAFPKSELEKVAGLIIHKGEGIGITKPREILDVNKIPVLDRTFIHSEYFKPRIMHDNRVGVSATMLTTRGCYFLCRFCSTTRFWKRVRFHPTEIVVREIKNLYEVHNVKSIDMWDDLFTISKKRLRDIIEGLRREGILGKITFNCQSKVSVIDEEICQLLKELNVAHLGFGFESGSDKVLRWLKADEKLSVEQNRKATLLAKKYGFLVNGSLIFGSPVETIEDMRETFDLIDFFIEQKVDCIWAFILTPFPATPIWEIARERGHVNDHDMDWDKLGHSTGNPLLLNESVSKEEFMQLFLECQKKLKYFKWQKVKRDIKRGHIFYMVKNTINNPKLLYNMLFKKGVVAETK